MPLSISAQTIAETFREAVRQRAIGDEVASEQHDIRIERVDAADYLTYEIRLRKFVIVDIADLRDAQSVERFGQAAQPMICSRSSRSCRSQKPE